MPHQCHGPCDSCVNIMCTYVCFILVCGFLDGNLETYSKHAIQFMKAELVELAKKLEFIVSSGTT
jgi:hypothetical protein